MLITLNPLKIISEEQLVGTTFLFFHYENVFYGEVVQIKHKLLFTVPKLKYEM